MYTEIILCMLPADERRRYIVTSSLIGWAHTQNDACVNIQKREEFLFWFVPVRSGVTFTKMID